MYMKQGRRPANSLDKAPEKHVYLRIHEIVK